jgi:hypothetical protein
MLTWQQFYEINKNTGMMLNEIVMQYNMYVYQNEEQENVELIRKLGEQFFIMQENGYTLLQEGINQYALLQEDPFRK